ncbi:MAG: low molecular weight phosphotyrosine protein phosphatase [Saprospiraceae bacterium]|nr:low molecular weight phosphotyrosine protein phosphatase [Saprospiraceae bacterium]
MKRILFVCLGNICRSPLAEGILRAKVQAKGLDWFVDSAGTSGMHAGALPDIRSVEIAKARGLDILDQRSRQFNKSDFFDFDFVYVMDKLNLKNVSALADSDKDRSKVALIMDEVYQGQHTDVPDPYWNDDGFAGVYDMLDKACDAILQKHLDRENIEI